MKNLLFLLMLLSIQRISAQELSTEEKVFGLSIAWEKAKTHFAYFDQTPVNWDSLYFSYLEKVTSTKTTKAYYNELIQFYAQLNDGHTWIWYPDSINNQINTIPIRTRLIEGKIIVTKVFHPTLKDKIDIGDEILKIDGVNANQYGNRLISPFVSSSTEQDRVLRTYGYDLFLGDINQPVHLEFAHHKSNSIQSLTVSRALDQFVPFQSYEFDVLNGNIGYLKINTFYDQNYRSIFDSIYQKILSTDALIIDLRQNGGGSGLQANYVLSHFIQKPTLSAQYKLRLCNDTTWEKHPAEPIYPQKQQTIFTQPVALLIGSGTYSAAEDFCVAFDQANRGIKVGTKTAGSTGNSIGFDLPGGGYGQVTFKRDSYADGHEFVGIGIPPKYPVLTTIEDYINNTDPVLQKALDVLKK